MTGDEWKAGTSYEDPEERAKRELHAAAQDAARAMAGFAESMRALGRSMVISAARRHAIASLQAHGVPKDEAATQVDDCILVAAADGRSVSGAIRALIRKRVTGEQGTGDG